MERQEVEEMIDAKIEERWNQTFSEERCPVCEGFRYMISIFDQYSNYRREFKCLRCSNIFKKEEKLIKI